MTLVALTKPLSLKDIPLDKLNDFDGIISDESIFVLINGRGPIRCREEVLRDGAADELLLPLGITEDHSFCRPFAGGRFSYMGLKSS